MKKLKARQWWRLFLVFLPFWGALNNTFAQYHYVNGQWVEWPFSWERMAEGFLTGLVIAVVLFGLTVLVGAIWRRFKSN